MIGPADIGRVLIILGGLVVVAGVILTFASRIPFLGRLPGDLFFRSGNVTVFFPIATMIILSIVLTILLNLVPRIFR